MDRRQFLVVDVNRAGDVLGCARVGATHIATKLADEADLAGRERRLLGGLEAGEARNGADRLDAHQIGRREDRAA